MNIKCLISGHVPWYQSGDLPYKRTCLRCGKKYDSKPSKKQFKRNKKK